MKLPPMLRDKFFGVVADLSVDKIMQRLSRQQAEILLRLVDPVWSVEGIIFEDAARRPKHIKPEDRMDVGQFLPGHSLAPGR